MSTNARRTILAAARKTAQAHGYGGLSYRDLAAEVASRRRASTTTSPARQTSARRGAALLGGHRGRTRRHAGEDRRPDGMSAALSGHFRRSLEDGNRLCLCSFMSAEYANLPEAVQREAQGFAEVNIAWLAKVLAMARAVKPEDAEARARAIFAAVSGAQLYARSRSDVSQFDALIEGYRASGLLPA